jgi:hypothetical protein
VILVSSGRFAQPRPVQCPAQKFSICNIVKTQIEKHLMAANLFHVDLNQGICNMWEFMKVIKCNRYPKVSV